MEMIETEQALGVYRSVSLEHRHVLAHELPEVLAALLASFSSTQAAEEVYEMVRADLERWFDDSRRHTPVGGWR